MLIIVYFRYNGTSYMSNTILCFSPKTRHIKLNIFITAGVQTDVYHARPLNEDGGIVFTRIRQTMALKNADHGQTEAHDEQT